VHYQQPLCGKRRRVVVTLFTNLLALEKWEKDMVARGESLGGEKVGKGKKKIPRQNSSSKKKVTVGKV